MERVIVLLLAAAVIAACAPPPSQQYAGATEQVATQQCGDSRRRNPDGAAAYDFCLTLHRRYVARATGRPVPEFRSDYAAPIRAACYGRDDCEQRLWALAREGETVR